MNFLLEQDFTIICDKQTLDTIYQSDSSHLDKAEKYAIEEVCSYIGDKYDMQAAFSTSDRNEQLVMITCDIAIYHLIAWLPKKMGFEIRETRYNRAIQWLTSVSKGTVTPALPVKQDEQGNDAPTAIRYGSQGQSQYTY